MHYKNDFEMHLEKSINNIMFLCSCFLAERAPPRPPLPREGLAPQRPPPPETDDEDEGVFRTMPHANQPILVTINFISSNQKFFFNN